LEEVVRVARCCGNVPCRPEIIYMMYSGLGNVSFFHGCSYNCLAINFMCANAGLESIAIENAMMALPPR
jgi:hypothetical protein